MNVESESLHGLAEAIDADGALASLPLFPLPGTVLLPGSLLSLHVFEPRYRAMVEDCIDGHRVLAVALLDEQALPDAQGRPAIHPIVGAGILRRAAKLPDGRFNIVIEGILRADVSVELPQAGLPYRRARARWMRDECSSPRSRLDAAVVALRALCARAVAQIDGAEGELIARLNEVRDPGELADLVAGSVVVDSMERQRVLAAVNVEARIESVAGILGAMLLSTSDIGAPNPPASMGWGIAPGKA